MTHSFTIERLAAVDMAVQNCVFLSPSDHERIAAEAGGKPLYLEKGGVVILAEPSEKCRDGRLMLGTGSRERWRAELNKPLIVRPYVPKGVEYAAQVSLTISKLKAAPGTSIDTDALSTEIRRGLVDRALMVQQEVLWSFEGRLMTLTVGSFELFPSAAETLLQTAGGPQAAQKAAQAAPQPSSEVAIVTQSTNVTFTTAEKNLTLTGDHQSAQTSDTAARIIKLMLGSGQAGMQPGSSEQPADGEGSVESLGIGGLDAQFGQIFRRAFASRIFPPHVVKNLGIQHVKGILLYGPAGTGKTLIARTIGQLLQTREPKIVSGPEILDKYVGQSEENIRKLFADAEEEWKEKGEASELHLIIMDELDAVCKQRGMKSDSTGTFDSIVNQLLAKMDGPESLGNILVVGMTNRRDLIDVALLRSGRFEIQIEISLPDEKGRAQILRIHTKKLSQSKALADDVDIEELARLTPNFSGAEIAGLVRSAVSFAMTRVVGTTGSGMTGKAAGSEALVKAFSESAKDMRVTMGDFHAALEEVKAGFGRCDSEDLDLRMPMGFLDIVGYDNTAKTDALDFIRMLTTSTITTGSLLLYGPVQGCGKTALCAKIAQECDCEFVKFLTAEDMILKTSTEGGRSNYICSAFEDAYKVPKALIILDGLESLVQFSPIGMRFSNVIVQTLIALIKKPAPTGHHLVVLGTTSCLPSMRDIGLSAIFDRCVPIRLLDPEQAFACVSQRVQNFHDKAEAYLAELRRKAGSAAEELKLTPEQEARHSLLTSFYRHGHDGLNANAGGDVQAFKEPLNLRKDTGIAIKPLLMGLEFALSLCNERDAPMDPTVFQQGIDKFLPLFD